MIFRIAREVGGMTVAELSRRMSSRELSEWIALFRIEAEEQRQRELGQRAELNRQAAKQRL